MSKRILFVDDEERVLDGMRRMLRSQQGDWEMTFVLGGNPALAALGGAPFDVVVTDMKMADMDGAQLLATIKERWPEVVRIVLSGQTETEAASRTVSVAHQFLTKPCDVLRLRATVDRACALRTVLESERLRRVVGGIDSLPSLPRVYSELTALLADPDATLRAVAQIVERDPAVTAKVLQLVNSAFFGLPRELTSIPQAVAYLGTNALQNLVLSVGAFDGFEGAARRAKFSIQQLQQHSVATGSLARRLMTEGRAGDEAFTAGMLHDVGKLVLACRLSGEFKEALSLADTEGLPMHQAEQRVIGVSHAELGAYLLGLWGLPPNIVEAVALHHAPEQVPHGSFGILDAVHVADRLVSEVQKGGLAETAGAIDLEYLGRLGKADELANWRALAAEQLGVPVAVANAASS